MSKWKRWVRFKPAYDKRDSDPNKNYGIHGVEIWFYLRGEKGGVSFHISTGWQLPHVQTELDNLPPHPRFPYLRHKPMAADLSYHSPVPIREWQEEPQTESCELTGGACYSDRTGLGAEPVFDALRRKGDEGVWEEMKRYYRQVFEEDDGA